MKLDVIFCTINGGINKFGSRGIKNSIGWSELVVNGTSTLLDRNNVNDTVVDMLEFACDVEVPIGANGCIVAY